MGTGAVPVLHVFPGLLPVTVWVVLIPGLWELPHIPVLIQ